MTNNEPSKAEIKIRTARIKLQITQPFFSWLTMAMKIIEDKNMPMPTTAVDQYGNLYYNPEYIEKATPQETETIICHEVLHVAFMHPTRRGERDPYLYNIACDIIVNNMLVNNGFVFGESLKGCIIPKNNSIMAGGEKIDKINEKSVEEIYDLLQKLVKEGKIKLIKGGEYGYQDKNGEHKLMDNHKHAKSQHEETKEEKERREKTEKEWKSRLAEAQVHSKNQGKEPLGAERYIEALLETKMNWRETLYRFITTKINNDWTYNRPSKRSVATGYYMPSIKKDPEDRLELTIAIDVSGSIGQKELSEFASEIVGIGTAFKEVKMHVLFWDTECNNHYELETSNIEDITSFKIKGGGGTDFTKIYEYIEENIPENKLLVFFTDGYCDWPKKSNKYETLWILAKESISENEVPFGEVIKMQ